MPLNAVLLAFILSGTTCHVSDTSFGDSLRVKLYPKKDVLHALITPAPSVPTQNSNHSLGFTFRSNYHKNVPIHEQTPDDNVSYRPYIQTTSGGIYYYDEIYRMGRRH